MTNRKFLSNTLYFFLENQSIGLVVVAVACFLLRFLLAFHSDGVLPALGSSVEFAGIMATSFIAALIFFKDAVNKKMVQQISQEKHTAIFGLGKMSESLLQQEAKVGRSAYIIFEKQFQSEKMEFFKKSGMGLIEGDVFDDEYWGILNFETMENAVITLGDDRLSIELATKIIDHYNAEKLNSPLRITVHIVNPDLDILFHQSLIHKDTADNKLEIQTFSFFKEIAEGFYENHYVDGAGLDILNSDQDYGIIIVGTGELASNIIAETAKVAHLPNENKLTIHIVDKEADQFKEYILKRYAGIQNVLNLQAHNQDENSIDFYENDQLWHQSNLSHIIVCSDDESKNFTMTIDLFNKVYLHDIIDDTLSIQINTAIFNSHKLNDRFDSDKDMFKQFYTFGDIHQVCTRANLLDNNHHKIAKLVNFQYAENYMPDALHDLGNKEVLTAIDKKWFNGAKYSDQQSSITQSKHISLKLKALGLKAIKSSETPKDLLTHNRKVLDASLQADRKQINLTDKELLEYSKELPKLWGSEADKQSIQVKYFPQEYKSMFEKLIRAEHNRWNAFHYVNGWVYGEVKNKPKKVHDCLKPLADFDDALTQLTVVYDIYAILYIPNYLANTGYKIIKF